MSGDAPEQDPKVIAWRMNVLEAQVATLIGKVDQVREILASQAKCPSPGSCIQIAEEQKRLAQIVVEHERQLSEFAKALAESRGGMRVLVWVAAGLSSFAGVLVNLAMQWLTK